MVRAEVGFSRGGFLTLKEVDCTFLQLNFVFVHVTAWTNEILTDMKWLKAYKAVKELGLPTYVSCIIMRRTCQASPEEI